MNFPNSIIFAISNALAVYLLNYSTRGRLVHGVDFSSKCVYLTSLDPLLKRLLQARDLHEQFTCYRPLSISRN